ncbi:MAG TPA: hypothetical protein PK729_15180, partial [Candidatus Hydrogenedentes bacterium]|nr:hypothetical protein [Candidatus Hydrogenedentota bacterium]
MTVHGEMRIVPLSGSGGVFEGPAAVTVVWPWGLHAIRFIPWACVLFLALLAANRATGAWLALLPAAALQVISMLCEVFFPRATDVIDGLLLLALGLSLLWLMGAVLARRSIPEIVLGALCSLALPALGRPHGGEPDAPGGAAGAGRGGRAGRCAVPVPQT